MKGCVLGKSMLKTYYTGFEIYSGNFSKCHRKIDFCHLQNPSEYFYTYFATRFLKLPLEMKTQKLFGALLFTDLSVT
jgi:hypothetical protein